jgi:NADH-quinone oxidoreductase subunit M
LLVRIALPLAPDGLEYWRPLVVPVLIVGIWHAAARARWPLLAAGAGLLGVAGLTPAGMAGAGWLLGSAFALELCSMLRLSVGTIRLAWVAIWVPAAWGGLLVLEGGLRGEVVYTALSAAGLAILIASRRRQAITASVPSTTESSA